MWWIVLSSRCSAQINLINICGIWDLQNLDYFSTYRLLDLQTLSFKDESAFTPACQLLQDGTMDNYIKLLQEHRVSHLVCATDQVRYYLALRTHAAVLLSD